MIKIHPIYSHYGYGLDNNQIVHVPTNKTVKQREHSSGYSLVTVSDGHTQKSILYHRFVWECNNDVIPKDYEIDHIDKNKTNNHISNLRCITMKENRKNRDHTNILKYARIAHTLKRFIKAIIEETNETCCFRCKNQCAKHFGISPAMVYLICAGKNMAKTANTNKGKCKFEYIDEKDVENLIVVPRKCRGLKE